MKKGPDRRSGPLLVAIRNGSRGSEAQYPRRAYPLLSRRDLTQLLIQIGGFAGAQADAPRRASRPPPRRDLTQLLIQIGGFAGAQADASGRLVAGVEVGVSHGAVEIDAVARFENLGCVEFGVKVDAA